MIFCWAHQRGKRVRPSSVMHFWPSDSTWRREESIPSLCGLSADMPDGVTFSFFERENREKKVSISMIQVGLQNSSSISVWKEIRYVTKDTKWRGGVDSYSIIEYVGNQFHMFKEIRKLTNFGNTWLTNIKTECCGKCERERGKPESFIWIFVRSHNSSNWILSSRIEFHDAPFLVARNIESREISRWFNYSNVESASKHVNSMWRATRVPP